MVVELYVITKVPLILIGVLKHMVEISTVMVVSLVQDLKDVNQTVTVVRL